MMERGKKPTQFEEFDRKTQELIQAVGEAMQLPDYNKIFSNYENKYVLPKFVCYYVLYERGFSYPHIGSKFKRNHTTIMYAIKKAKQMPECMVIANLVNAKLKSLEEKEATIRKYRNEEQKTALLEKIKGLINSGMSDEEVCQKMEIPEEIIGEIIRIIKTECRMKKIPDYKNCTIKQIYV